MSVKICSHFFVATFLATKKWLQKSQAFSAKNTGKMPGSGKGYFPDCINIRSVSKYRYENQLVKVISCCLPGDSRCYQIPSPACFNESTLGSFKIKQACFILKLW